MFLMLLLVFQGLLKIICLFPLSCFKQISQTKWILIIQGESDLGAKPATHL